MTHKLIVVFSSCIILALSGCSYATDPFAIRPANSPTSSYADSSCGQLADKLGAWQIKHDVAFQKQAERRYQDKRWTTIAWTTGVLLIPLFGLFGLNHHGNDIDTVQQLAQAKADLQQIRTRMAEKC